jgi:hypothetical protein
MLIEDNLWRRFGAEAVDTAVHLKNRPTVAVKGMTHEEARSSTKVHLSHLRHCGYRAYMHITDQKMGSKEQRSSTHQIQ